MASAPPKLSAPSSARVHLLTNLLVLPGLGSFLAGRRVVGILQAVPALVGFALTGFWFVTFLTTCVQTATLPLDGGPHLGLGLAGVGLFVAAWCWALVTGLAILHAARTGNQ